MNELGGFLLSLHASAREVPFENFQQHALTLLKQILPFDSARWGVVCHDARGADFHKPFLFNDSPETLKDYDAFRQHDIAARWCLTHLERALNLQLTEAFARVREPGLLEYAQRYRHVQALIVGGRANGEGLHQSISLYGAYEARPFSEAQRNLLECVFAHLSEALQTSLAFQMERVRPRATESVWALAVCDPAGYFRFVEPTFRILLRDEWPTRQPSVLPAELARLIVARSGGAANGGDLRYEGRAALFSIQIVHDVVFVRARARLPVDALSRRERDVARLVVAGRTYKEIARALSIAPATVRNHLQAIHERAGVHSNAELVQQFRRAGL